MRRALAELVSFGRRRYPGHVDAYMVGLRIGLDLTGRSPAVAADVLEDLDASHEELARRRGPLELEALERDRELLEELALRAIEVGPRWPMSRR